jgi:hypothetical protein
MTFVYECDSFGLKWGTTSNLPDLELQLQILTSTGATAAQQVSVLQTEQYLSVLSDA